MDAAAMVRSHMSVPGSPYGCLMRQFLARDWSDATNPALLLVEAHGREYLVAALQFVLFKM